VLDQEGRSALHRYLQGLRDLVAGDNEWEHTSGRYVVDAPAASPSVLSPSWISSSVLPRSVGDVDGAEPAPSRGAPEHAAPSSDSKDADRISVPQGPAGLGTSAARLFAKTAAPTATEPVPAGVSPPALAVLGTSAARLSTLLAEERAVTTPVEP